MTVDELRAGFARLAEPVVPMADPYGRLLRRAQRSRRARLAGWLSGLAAALVAVLVTPLLVQASGPTPTPMPSPGVDDLRGAAISPWVRQLLDTPVRGSLANDKAFLSTLTDGLAPGDFGFSPELNQRTVLFAGDTGGYRAVLVAFHSATNQMGVWLLGDAGESATQLAADAAADRARQLADPSAKRPIMVLPEELTPVTGTAVSEPDRNRYLAVAVAPRGCQVMTNDQADPAQLRASADTDYVARTDPFSVSISSTIRVTCDGVVRRQGPLTDAARTELALTQPTQQQVDAAMVGARGDRPDRAQVTSALTTMLSMGRGVSNTCRVLYTGRLPATAGGATVPNPALGDPPLLALACTTTHGNTTFEVSLASGPGSGGNSRVKLTDPRAVMVMPAMEDPVNGNDRALVLAPPTATLLQVLKDGQLTQSVPLSAGVGSLRVTRGQTVQVRALDAGGAVVGTGTAPMDEQIPEEDPQYIGPVIDDWN